MPGTLFVVATPIGNLEDLSFRALRTLKEVALIAAEDTRRTAKLLAHYAIRQPMVSLREHNERRETPRLIARLLGGQSIALVSDAGTPGISDPGQHFVKSAREAGIQVSPIPGPSAVMAALSASGVPADQFVFMGFPPRSGEARTAWFQRLAGEPRTLVFFEAPHRVARTLDEARSLLVNRQIIIHRELTKYNEQLVVYTNIDAASTVPSLGEFVVVVGQSANKEHDIDDTVVRSCTALRIFECLTNNSDFSSDEAELLASCACSLDLRVVRKAVKKSRIAQKRRDEALS